LAVHCERRTWVDFGDYKLCRKKMAASGTPRPSDCVNRRTAF
jgi:hypothetical protein